MVPEVAFIGIGAVGIVGIVVPVVIVVMQLVPLSFLFDQNPLEAGQALGLGSKR